MMLHVAVVPLITLIFDYEHVKSHLSILLFLGFFVCTHL